MNISFLYNLKLVLFKSLGLVRLLNIFYKTHKHCIYLIKNTIKTVILNHFNSYLILIDMVEYSINY